MLIVTLPKINDSPVLPIYKMNHRLISHRSHRKTLHQVVHQSIPVKRKIVIVARVAQNQTPKVRNHTPGIPLRRKLPKKRISQSIATAIGITRINTQRFSIKSPAPAPMNAQPNIVLVGGITIAREILRSE